MRICLVVNYFPALNESFVVNKAVSLIRRGHKVTIVCFRKNLHLQDAFEKYYFDDSRIDIKSFPDCQNRATIILQAIKKPFLFFSSFNFNFKTFKRNFATAVYIHQLNSIKAKVVHFEKLELGIFFASMMKSIKAMKVVSCDEPIDEVFLNNDEQQERLISMLDKVQLVHCISEKAKKDLLNVYHNAEKFFVNYPAVDTYYFTPANSPVKNKNFQIISVSKIQTSKGYLVALKAIKKVSEKFESIQWNIIGDGPFLDELKFQIKKNNLEDVVNLLGVRSKDEVNSILNKADCFLLTTFSEGVSTAVLEAMSKEMPIIVTGSESITEAIEDGVDGLISPANDYEHVAANLERLIEEENLRVSLGKNAREKVLKKFTLQQQAEIFEKMYKSIM